ncbi:hypothetical protein BS47DRAFT_1303295 [Hydnum rufescens UP504]|uniref:Uncharacterized protein n=1 Tax=Hydnum rufescens UP504 TaxID=1448309 RepID=A0A9P6ALQ1_9AGAM|nr:hypothetical protein BS47DRAFT_1303295 [Hydnum rufescens UP504]
MSLGDAWPSLGLAQGGYLAATPVNPTVVISIQTLDLYYLIIQCVLSFSAQSFA